MEERIQKLMAQAGLGSRRHNEELISQGRVKVNGRIAHLGQKADPVTDRIEVDGKLLDLQKDAAIYIALHKPKGVLSSLEDEMEEGRTTVRDLIDVEGHLYPVGRLDRQSEGLILMTNDGDLAHKITHPRYGHRKIYEVTLEGNILPEAIAQWQQGVMLDNKRTAPARIENIRRQGGTTRLQIVMREGRKRQIRRVAAQLGYPVQRLVRQQIGPLKLGDLAAGMWRHLTPIEVKRLKQSVNTPRPKPPQPSRRKGK
jgi:pseudouridine synthase